MTLKRTGPPKRNKPLRADPETKRAFIDRGRESSAKPTRKPISPASPAQRAKVKAHGVCIVCGSNPEWDGVPLDPMHVIDRSLAPDLDGDPLRVVPGCRRCHSEYDDGRLDLLPHLEPLWRDELAEAVRLLGLLAALQRITNARWSEAA